MQPVGGCHSIWEGTMVFTRFLKVAAVAAMATFVGVAGSNAADTKIKIASTNKKIFDNLPFFVAMDQGLFQREGLQIELSHFRGGGEVVRAVASGAADIGMVATTAGIIAAGRGVPLKLISAWSAPAFGIAWVVMPNSPIKSVKELAGKKVGISRPGSVTHTGLLAVLKANGLQGKVDIVPVGGPGDGFAALKSGRVAATWFPAPDLYRLVDSGKVRIVSEISHYLTQYQQGSLWAGESYLAKNGDTVKKFVKAVAAAIDFIDKSPETAAKSGAKHAGYDEKTMLRTIKEMPKGFFKIGVPENANFAGSAAEAAATGAIKSAPSLDKVLDKRFLP